MATDSSASPSRSRMFYVTGSVIALLVVFWGFAKTYYLKVVFGTPEIRPLVQLHGLVMTAWFTLFLVQAWLVASKKIRLHRRLGILGAFLALALVVVGTATAITGAKLGHTPGPPPLIFLVVPIVDLFVFTTLIALGLFLRNNRESHRRLMFLGSLSILTAAIARIPVPLLHDAGLMAFFLLKDAIILAFVVYDTWRSRRLHPAFGWGALFIIVSFPLRMMLAGTHAWMQFATWVTR
ncbi:MAG: hypothetical protein JST05_03265 [Acidobacteria bacterium]|nr:hypothetical protein [Acidobacteriota bacterium]